MPLVVLAGPGDQREDLLLPVAQRGRLRRRSKADLFGDRLVGLFSEHHLPVGHGGDRITDGAGRTIL